MKFFQKTRGIFLLFIVDFLLIALICVSLITVSARSRASIWAPVDSAQEPFDDPNVKSRWGIYEGKGNEGYGWRTASAITVKDGFLHITARGDVSGGMSQKFSQIYGRWEIVARQEIGQGYGPAILLWPDSGKWPDDGEIDIVEIPGGKRDMALSSVHYGPNNSKYANSSKGDFSRWHTYAVEWTPERVTFFLDKKQTFEVTDPLAIPRVPMHLAVQNDVGRCGSFIGCRDGTTPDSVALIVKSVKVWKLKQPLTQ